MENADFWILVVIYVAVNSPLTIKIAREIKKEIIKSIN